MKLPIGLLVGAEIWTMLTPLFTLILRRVLADGVTTFKT